jgi:hypothetical protein
MTMTKSSIMSMLCVAALTCGCARAKMQDSAGRVAEAVGALRADVERQQGIRTELARNGVDRLARSEAELAAHEARRAATRARLSEAADPLLRHSKAVSEAADPRFVPTIAREIERRETAIEYRRHVDELESLHALLERLAAGSIRNEIELYLEVGGAAAEAAKAAWTR